MEEVEIHGKKVRAINRQLYLQQMEIKDLNNIKGLENLDNLEELYLQSNDIKEISNLESLRNLKILFLNNNKITEIKGLENLKNLELLSLLDNEITQIKGLNNLVNLKVLNLSENHISRITGLKNTNNLERIYLAENQISKIEGLETLHKLRILTLGKNPLLGSLLEKLGGLDMNGKAKEPQKFVKYCSHTNKTDDIVVSMVLDSIPGVSPKSTLNNDSIKAPIDDDGPIIEAIIDLYHKIPKDNNREPIVPKTSSKRRIEVILEKIPDQISQNRFIEALELLEEARELTIKNNLDERATEIYLKIQDIKNQRMNFHIDNALKVFKSSVKCTISDIKEYLSSNLPDLNITEGKLRLKLMSRINKLNINAIFHEDSIIYKDSIIMQQNLEDFQSDDFNGHQPLTTEKKYCIICGEYIDREAKICPYCGVFQEKD